MAYNERTILAMGQEQYEKIIHHHVLIIGVGGVGGAVLECLVRFGMERISIIDFDEVDESNLNRQLISTVDAVGRAKVDVAKERALSIRPDSQIDTYKMFIDESNLEFLSELNPDYIVDAFDTVKGKLDVIQYCRAHNIPIISSMGTGNRFRCDGFVIDTVEKTAGNGCGLSKVMRTELRKRGIEGHIALFNKYPPESKAVNEGHGRHAPGSTVFAPNTAGILIAQYVCEQLGK